jgi:hypothetical protein
MVTIEFDDDMLALIYEAKDDDETLEEFVNSVLRRLATDLKRQVVEKKKLKLY